jgi:diguanylate cyclase (GGDEF)-like protein
MGAIMALFTYSSKIELLGRRRSFRLHRLYMGNHILQYASSRDALTGIPNRQQLDLVLEHQWRCAITAPAVLSLFLIKIDHFEEYCATLGVRAAGNCVKQVACFLSNTLSGPGALVGRLDEDRFMAILPRTTVEEAAAIAKPLPAIIEGWKIPHPSSPLGPRVTISIGAATVAPQLHSKPKALVQETEQALTQAQEQGGNQAVTRAPDRFSTLQSTLLRTG